MSRSGNAHRYALCYIGLTNNVITALHVMQMRYSDEHSVRLSVTHVYSDETEVRSVQIFIPNER